MLYDYKCLALNYRPACAGGERVRVPSAFCQLGEVAAEVFFKDFAV